MQMVGTCRAKKERCWANEQVELIASEELRANLVATVDRMRLVAVWLDRSVCGVDCCAEWADLLRL